MSTQSGDKVWEDHRDQMATYLGIWLSIPKPVSLVPKIEILLFHFHAFSSWVLSQDIKSIPKAFFFNLSPISIIFNFFCVCERFRFKNGVPKNDVPKNGFFIVYSKHDLTLVGFNFCHKESEKAKQPEKCTSFNGNIQEAQILKVPFKAPPPTTKTYVSILAIQPNVQNCGASRERV